MNDSRLLKHLIWALTNDAAIYLAGYADLLRPEHFEDRALRWIVEQALAYYTTYGKPITLQVIEVMLDGMSAADQQAIGVDADDIRGLLESSNTYVIQEDSRQFIYDAVRLWARKQAAARQVEEVDEQLDSDPDAAIDRLRRIDVPELVDESELVLGADGDDIAEVLKAIQRRDQPGQRITTGFDAIDTLLHGGVRRRELAVVLAPTGVGKSNFLVWIARSALRLNHIVLVYTLEMPSDDWYCRILASLTRIPHTDLTDNPSRTAKAAHRIVSLYQIQKGRVIVRTLLEGGRSVAHLRQEFEKLELAGLKPDLVIVDYADLLNPARKYEKSYDAMGDVYAGLHDLAVAKDVAVWTASQANREALGRAKLRIRHFADSLKKANVSDYIFALCQTEEEKRGEDADGNDSGDKQERMRIVALKTRRSGGVLRELHVAVDPEICIFRPIISPEFAETMEEDPMYPPPRSKVHYD